MVPFAILILTLIIQLASGYNNEDFYSDNFDGFEEPSEEVSDMEVRRRNSNFLRFGRSGPNYEYEDYGEDFARPTRSGKIEKNDHFIRFGRSKQDFLRFGRNQPKATTNYLRFGRRNKRDTSNFLRFGRNSNFLRFGRNNESSYESPLVQLLSSLLKKEENKQRIV
ncbi:FMRFamide-related [Tribolium castaneum]|uniref:FMRFamide-related n=1 Tax=Tribolium castaneum TaxID=7070 RepID=D2A1T0_TRICA|nr:PREDICTED: FMRFamide-related neuropeptides [Tribolium castaneum]XP_008191573.1 PREDICTED: FMRFamide-related neuropeptides [Tribolium castaneum]XP_008191574.1 PREDICTED: FMRFamide-related neuropeptides [Tribolium castaneum]EFA02863.1 FMRFamide-related [Tribolium castaneum]|eukprot:XP_008191572.1 PREDICTED: FMRFamide-related neuropeptides [Tribolium castaneum]